MGPMDLVHALRTTGAVRDFLPDPVPDEVLARVLETARFSPSGGNAQGWRVVVVADPAILSHYFTTGGAQGRLETGGTVIWDFADFPGAFPVEVVSADEKSDIELRWAASDPDAETPYQTTVIISFAAVDGGRRTKVTISENN